MTYNNSIQVVASHYNFDKYVDAARWNSYYHQIAETLAFAAKTALIIGVGDNIVPMILSQQGVSVTTFDFDKDLQPDIVGDVTDIENILTKDGFQKFDVLLCCQVLEHLPYDYFEKTLAQFRNVANNVILSLPFSAHKYHINIKLPLIKIRFSFYINWVFTKYKFNGQHYWEIGRKGFFKNKIIKSIKKIFTVKKVFLATHNNYHLFFILHS